MPSFEQPNLNPAEKKPAPTAEELAQRRIEEQKLAGEERGSTAEKFFILHEELFEKTMETIGDIAKARSGKKGNEKMAEAMKGLADSFKKAQEEMTKELEQSEEKRQERIVKIEQEIEKTKAQTPEEILRESLKSIGGKEVFEAYWPKMLLKIIKGEDVEGFAPELQQKIKKFHEQATELIFKDTKAFQKEFDELKKEAFQSWLSGREKK